MRVGQPSNCGADSQSAAPRLISAHGRRAKKRVETSLDPAGKSARATVFLLLLPLVLGAQTPRQLTAPQAQQLMSRSLELMEAAAGDQPGRARAWGAPHRRPREAQPRPEPPPPNPARCDSVQNGDH